VDDAALVSMMDGPGQGLDEPGGRTRRQGRPFQALGQAAALDILQRAVGAAERAAERAGPRADLEDLHDVRMLQPGDRLRLAMEARQLLGIGKGTAQDHLQSHEAIELDVAGLEDDPHAAPSQLPQHLVPLHVRQRRALCGGALLGRGLVR
jgi:hypothetical protein